ncbi:restriction endonuclease [bacterium]|nr:restriction endonuclease [bacterium]
MALPVPLSALDKIRHSIEAQRAQVRSDLIGHLSTIDPFEFEHLIKELLERMSFTDCEVTQRSKDGGIDLLANFSIGISDIRTVCQVKRQKASIGAPVLQQFYGAMNALKVNSNVHLGLFVTTSHFASSAVTWVEQSALPLALIDGDRLADLLIEHGVLVRSVEMPPGLELTTAAVEDAGEAQPEDAEGEVDPVTASQVTEHKQLFRWPLEWGPGDSYVLRAEYLPDPSLSFEVGGVRVPPEGDFVAARTKLQKQILAHMEQIFPDLPKGRQAARSWSGVHKVYPAEHYGK